MSDHNDNNDGDEQITHKRRTYILGQTLIGIHWPVWKLKQHFANIAKPKIKKALVFTGVRGFLLDASYGEASGTSKVFECHEDEVAATKTLARKADLQDPDDFEKVWAEVVNARRIKVKTKGAISADWHMHMCI